MRTRTEPNLARDDPAYALLRHGGADTVGFVLFRIHLGQALGDPYTSWYVGPYYQCVVGTLTLGIAYLVDQRQRAGEDYALVSRVSGGRDTPRKPLPGGVADSVPAVAPAGPVRSSAARTPRA